VLSSVQKLTLGLLAIIALQVVPFLAYASFPELLPWFKCTLKSVFCEGVQHHLRFCLDHLNCFKIVAFQFYPHSGKQNSRVVGNYSNIIFGKKFSVEKGSVRRCVVVMQQPVPLSPKIGAVCSQIVKLLP
jgi:hypothetical protein